MGLLALLSFRAQAQMWELGLGVGTSLYKGELSRNYNPTFVSPAAQLIVRANMSRTVVVRGNFLYGELRGSQAFSDNLYFRQYTRQTFHTPVMEGAAMIEYNFFDWRKAKSRDRGTLYFVGGVGGFYFQPQNIETEVSPFQLCLPLGLGYKYRLSDHWNLNFEMVFRKTWTGQLDDTNDRLPENGTDLVTGQRYFNQSFPQRGFKGINDWYMFTGFNLTYTIKEIECPFDFY